MAIIEMNGGTITHRYLMNKTKFDLARMYLDLLQQTEMMAQECFQAVACIAPYDAEVAAAKRRAMRRTEAFLDNVGIADVRTRPHISDIP